MKTHKHLFYLWLVVSSVTLMGCPEEPPEPTNPYGEGNGQISFWTKSDLGVGEIKVYVENSLAGTITHYNANGYDCGLADVNVTKSAGNYSYSAVGRNGSTWTGNITIYEGKCNQIELTGNGTGNSGGGNTGGGNGSTGTSTPTVTSPSNQFLASQNYTVSTLGASFTEGFTLNKSTKLVFRFASQLQAQAAIISPNQLSSFKNNGSFTAYKLFDKSVGIEYVTLGPGQYYLAVRNSTNGPNKWSVELDYDILLPATDRATFYDNYFSGAKTFKTPTKFWQPFTIQDGFRYFMEGCNVDCETFIIPASSLGAFQNDQTFKYYTDYPSSGGGSPGLWEIKLQAGEYYLVSRNTVSNASLVYVMERWRVN